MLEHHVCDVTGDACSDGVLVYVCRRNYAPERADQQGLTEPVDFGLSSVATNGRLEQWHYLLPDFQLTLQLGQFITQSITGIHSLVRRENASPFRSANAG